MARLSALLPAILPLLLAGCFPRPDYRDLPNSSVIQREVRLVASASVADITAPTPAEKAAIAEALAKAGAGAIRVRLEVPPGVVTDEVAARALADNLGLDPAITRIEAKGAPGPVTIDVLRVTLSAPNCAAMVTPDEYANWVNPRPSMAFGCASYTNLSRMLTDPADLASPRAYGGADAATTAAAVDRYENDKVKPLKRSTTTSGLMGSSSQ